jgi:hypothetical protein
LETTTVIGEKETRDVFAADAPWRELGRIGERIYETQLKAELEPECDRQYIAIHVDTGDYAVAHTAGDAMRAINGKHPDSRWYVRRIGDEPEYGLAARIIASDMIAGNRK